jgi:predicted N-acetyltransferase YhbS
MGINQFSLRELQPSDSPALVKLITEFDGDMTTRFLVDAYQAIVGGTETRTIGVVAEKAGVDDLVGMGTIRFSKVSFNGDFLPLAFLDGLKVHKDFRGNGLGHQIAAWRIQRAKQEFGEDCVIGTGMLFDNHASHAVASKWCRDFAESALTIRFTPMRNKPPHALPGIQVRPVEAYEYEQFADRQNHFYRTYNLYPPCEPGSIDNALGVSVAGEKPYRYYTAVDARGNLLAGAQTWARGLLKADTINQLPALLRLVNKATHLLPADFTLRDVAVSGLWYEPEQFQAARFLWETMRWECRSQGSMLVASFDVRDLAVNVVASKPWHQPRPKVTLALHGPSALNRELLLFSRGRV